MKTRIVTGCLAISYILSTPSFGFCSGFDIHAQSAKAVSLGGAFVAQADDPSAVYYNPAGIQQLEGTQASGGMSAVIIRTEFRSDGNNPGTFPGRIVDVEEETFLIPNAYFTHKHSERFSLGFGVFSNFGLATEWPENWEGRFVTGGILSEVTTVSYNPVLAFKPTEKLSLAAGPVLQYLDFELRNKALVLALNPTPPPLFLVSPTEVDTKFEGDDWDWGWNVGLLYFINENLKLGASYRSEVSHSISDGTVRFSPEIPLIGINNTGIDTSISIPAIAYFGLAWTRSSLTLEFDAQWTEWSTFDELTASFAMPVGGESGVRVPKNWDNAWAWRFGVQYALNQYLDLRAGYFYDEGIIPDETLDPSLASGDRQAYAVGLGIHYGGFTVDLAYEYLIDEDRVWNNPIGDPPPGGSAIGLQRVTGEFQDTNAQSFVLNLSYQF